MFFGGHGVLNAGMHTVQTGDVYFRHCSGGLTRKWDRQEQNRQWCKQYYSDIIKFIMSLKDVWIWMKNLKLLWLLCNQFLQFQKVSRCGGQNASDNKWHEWGEAWVYESQAECMRFDRSFINCHGYDMSFCNIIAVHPQKLLLNVR